MYASRTRTTALQAFFLVCRLRNLCGRTLQPAEQACVLAVANMDISMKPLLSVLDLRHIFTPERLAEIADAERHAQSVDTRGQTSSSGLEASATAGLHYKVLNGDRVRDCLPWLHDLYASSAFIDALSAVCGTRLAPRVGDTSKWGANINFLSSGQRYEWHRDTSSGYTLLMFASGHTAAEGSELCFYKEPDRVLAADVDPDVMYAGADRIRPSPGFGVLFKGIDVAHAVSRNIGSSMRITIPMTYEDADVVVDGGLTPAYSAYLFGNTRTQNHK